jgi:hypothetical protein
VANNVILIFANERATIFLHDPLSHLHGRKAALKKFAHGKSLGKSAKPQALYLG